MCIVDNYNKFQKCHLINVPNSFVISTVDLVLILGSRSQKVHELKKASVVCIAIAQEVQITE